MHKQAYCSRFQAEQRRKGETMWRKRSCDEGCHHICLWWRHLHLFICKSKGKAKYFVLSKTCSCEEDLCMILGEWGQFKDGREVLWDGLLWRYSVEPHLNGLFSRFSERELKSIKHCVSQQLCGMSKALAWPLRRAGIHFKLELLYATHNSVNNNNHKTCYQHVMRKNSNGLAVVNLLLCKWEQKLHFILFFFKQSLMPSEGVKGLNQVVLNSAVRHIWRAASSSECRLWLTTLNLGNLTLHNETWL